MRRRPALVGCLVLAGCARAAGPTPGTERPIVAAVATDAGVGVVSVVAGAAPAGPALEHAGRRYQFWAAPGMAWDAAARACRANAAELATFATAAELAAFGDAARAMAALVDLDTVWLGGGPCAGSDPSSAELCWTTGAPVTIEYRGPYWVRNGRGQPRTHLFLRVRSQIAANDG